MDRRRNAGKFDYTKPLVSTKDTTIMGKPIKSGDPIPSEVGHGVRRRLWMTNKATYGEEQKAAPSKKTEQKKPAAKTVVKEAPKKAAPKKDEEE